MPEDLLERDDRVGGGIATIGEAPESGPRKIPESFVQNRGTGTFAATGAYQASTPLPSPRRARSVEIARGAVREHDVDTGTFTRSVFDEGR
jgi:hypothetical protein